MRIDPIFVTRIEDNQGNVLATFTPKSHDAISKRVAYTMITMMQRVVTMGTAGRMRYVYGFSDVEMAAKTGTTNDNVDAWFMCVLPNLVMSTWVGGEENSIHLRSGGEGASMALPVAGLCRRHAGRAPQRPLYTVGRGARLRLSYGYRRRRLRLDHDVRLRGGGVFLMTWIYKER